VTTRPPALVTKRLTLRELRTSDAAAVASRAGDQRVAKYLIQVPSPYPVSLAKRWIAGRIAWWDAGRGVTFAIVRKDKPDDLIGTMSLRRHLRDRRAELGYWLGAADWGHGFVTEAARAAVQFGFDELLLAKIYAQVLSGNDASERVLEKLGMQREGLRRKHVRQDHRLTDVTLFGLLRDEWPSAKRD
jgi:ribosomal-protein-alanine N-acetyltransferase